jgi:hypothetical protein
VKSFAVAALAALALGAGLPSSAGASSQPPLSLQGASGSGFVVTVRTSWRLDFQHMTVSGGRHYEGVALELLGRPANDGLTAVAVRLPVSARGNPTRTVTALGAVNVTMPAGKYLMVLIGDGPVRVSVPVVGSAKISSVAPTSRHRVSYVETTGPMTASPGAAGLYAGSTQFRLPLSSDPLVLTYLAVRLASGPQTFSTALCVRRDSGTCPEAQQPTFGTGSVTSDGGALERAAFYDGADGLSPRQQWFSRADVRGTARGSDLYAAAIVIRGDNA